MNVGVDVDTFRPPDHQERWFWNALEPPRVLESLELPARVETVQGARTAIGTAGEAGALLCCGWTCERRLYSRSAGEP